MLAGIIIIALIVAIIALVAKNKNLHQENETLVEGNAAKANEMANLSVEIVRLSQEILNGDEQKVALRAELATEHTHLINARNEIEQLGGQNAALLVELTATQLSLSDTQTELAETTIKLQGATNGLDEISRLTRTIGSIANRALGGQAPIVTELPDLTEDEMASRWS